MNDILTYLAARYDPAAIIVYGSFADGSSNLFSDFDALLITDGGGRRRGSASKDYRSKSVLSRSRASLPQAPLDYPYQASGNFADFSAKFFRLQFVPESARLRAVFHDQTGSDSVKPLAERRRVKK